MKTTRTFQWMAALVMGMAMTCVTMTSCSNDDNPVDDEADIPSDYSYEGHGSINGHEYVELGGRKWATCNLGANKPWENGEYYAWGATRPYYLTEYSIWVDGKTGYNWANYPFMEAGYADEKHITKYNSIDGKKKFADYNYVDDAARQRWGGTWRIPTNDEFYWLIIRNNSEWKTNYLGTGINGLLVSDKDDPDRCIFFPAAGWLRESPVAGYNPYAGSEGCYWASERLDTGRPEKDRNFEYDAYCLYINNNEDKPALFSFVNSRYFGQSIRPVSN